MKKFWFAIFTILLLNPFTTSAYSGDFEMTFDEKAQIKITQNGASIVTGKYVSWSHNWKWAQTTIKNSPGKKGTFTFKGSVSKLKLNISGEAFSSPKHTITILYKISSPQKWENINGFGMEWQLNMDMPVFDGNPKSSPTLSQKNGWEWEISPLKKISARFDPPIDAISFERNKKNRIRTLFFKASIPKGEHILKMTIDLPKGGRLTQSSKERYDKKTHVKWLKNALSLNEAPIDLSFLNHKPAGKYGFVTTKKDQLIFSNGTSTRFWGGNIAAYALFTKKENIRIQAKRIAKLGYNLMRIHHHDSTKWVKPTVIEQFRSDSRYLDHKAMDHLDFWIKCLKDEGVYIWLDLHVGRQFKEGDVTTKYGTLNGFDEIKRKKGEVKGFCYFNKTVQKLMMEFNEHYLKHLNPYTKLRYAEDPAIMGMLITNENDLTNHFGNLMLGNKGNPYHHQRFKKELDIFCQKSGLSPLKTAQTWLPGPSKIFLNDMEHRFNIRMLDHLKKINVKALLSSTNSWGKSAIFSLPALTDGDIIDVHSYGKDNAFNKNPRYESNYIGFIAMSKVADKPLSITEWNVPFPNPDRFTAPLYISSISALQGWNAPMIYNYSQTNDFKTQTIHTWSTFSDPSITGMMPAAALSFRKGHVQSAQKTYFLRLDREKTYYQKTSDTTSATIRTLVEQSRLGIGLPNIKPLQWDKATPIPKDAIVLTNTDEDFIPKGKNSVISDTGELWRNFRKGIQTINTPYTQATSGWIGEETITLSDISITCQTAKAVISIQSLSNHTLRDSQNIFISALARSESGMEKKRRVVWSEPVSATIIITSNHSLKLFPLSGSKQNTAIPIKKVKGGYQFQISPDDNTHWYLLKKEEAL